MTPDVLVLNLSCSLKKSILMVNEQELRCAHRYRQHRDASVSLIPERFGGPRLAKFQNLW